MDEIKEKSIVAREGGSEQGITISTRPSRRRGDGESGVEGMVEERNDMAADELDTMVGDVVSQMERRGVVARRCRLFGA